MANVFVALMYGQGGRAVDMVLSGDGIGGLANQLRALGSLVECPTPYTWDAGAHIAARVKKLPAGTKIVIGGASLGANETPAVCSMVAPRRVDFIFGCQPSLYGRKNLVPGNVAKALCVYAPMWAFWTLGFGSYQWQFQSKATQQMWMTSYLHHPGDQDPRLHAAVEGEVRALMKAP